jgi:hypothetical protein
METMNEIAGYLTPPTDYDDITTIPVTNQAKNKPNAPSSSSSHNQRTQSLTDSDAEMEGRLSNSSQQSSRQQQQQDKQAMQLRSSQPKSSLSLGGKPFSPDKCRHIPLRLSEKERNMLNVLLNALEVCEYTDVVDVTFSHTHKNKRARILESLVDILSIASGLMVSNNLLQGEALLKGSLCSYFSFLVSSLSFSFFASVLLHSHCC